MSAIGRLAVEAIPSMPIDTSLLDCERMTGNPEVTELLPVCRSSGAYLMAARIEISRAVIGKVGDTQPVSSALSNLL
jgi:hypothetical protein